MKIILVKVINRLENDQVKVMEVPAYSLPFPYYVGHIYEYPTMYYFDTSRHTQSMIAYKILTEYFWKS